MAKIIYQTFAQIELDTDTGKQRLIKAFSKVLGKGNSKKKKVKDLSGTLETEEM